MSERKNLNPLTLRKKPLPEDVTPKILKPVNLKKKENLEEKKDSETIHDDEMTELGKDSEF